MDNRESNLAWIIAGILLVLLIIVGYLWITSRNDLPTVLEEGRQDISELRNEIALHCNPPTRDEEQCQEDLADLEDLLEEFREDVQNAATTSPTAQ